MPFGKMEEKDNLYWKNLLFPFPSKFLFFFICLSQKILVSEEIISNKTYKK